MMNIEIKNVSDVNQGAHLMLRTIMAWCASALPKAEIAVDMRSLRSSTRTDYDLNLLTWSYFKSTGLTGHVTNGLAGLLPRSLRSKHNLVRDEDIDVVLDAAGFMYSDQWGAAGAERLVLDMKRRQPRGVKYILLPQAFGPFKSERTTRAVQEIGRRADLIYARDRVSLENLHSIGVNGGNVRLCPDMTFWLSPPQPPRPLPGNAVVIPNLRMVDKTSGETSRGYVPFLTESVERLRGVGFTPVFLIHESNDIQLAEEVNRNLDQPISVVVESDPVTLKSLIGQADLVLGSRFHGLVNALSQGVPTLAVGWSHKYEMLFEDMGVPGYVFRLEETDRVGDCISALSDPNKRMQLRRQLIDQSAVLKAKTTAMWDEVLECLR